MKEEQNRISQLLSRLEDLLRKQEDFQKEIDELRTEIVNLKSTKEPRLVEEKQITPEGKPLKEEPVRKPEEAEKMPVPAMKKPSRTESDIEKFIGENLINKIGIVITVIGVFIGAKYAIDHDLISPLTRIILAYLVGIGLLGFAIKLKKKYENFSAVLLSGALATLYFVTYIAYNFYDLIPQAVTFIVMVFFTIFAIIAAIHYNKQVIAHIGLVGAYAIPFLLSEDTGRAAILFSYMTIVNIGILVIAFKKYWNPLYYSSFLLTWFIYFIWYISIYEMLDHFGLSLVFLSIFFFIFYIIFLAFKLIQKQKFELKDIWLILANSFIFYGIGYSILNDHDAGVQLLGLFTLINAVIHFIVSLLIYRDKLVDRNLFYLISGLVLVFLTIAIPVQLDGEWVTLLWAGEAALLFWIGRTKGVPVYEKLSYPLIFLAFFSIIHDWIVFYGSYSYEQSATGFTPIFNINFLSSLLFITAFAFINILNNSKKYSRPVSSIFFSIMKISIPAILLIVIYYSFRMEISTYWNQLYFASVIEIKGGIESQSNFYHDFDFLLFKNIWLINYSMLFLSILGFVNIKRFKNNLLGLINLGLNTLAITLFLFYGLFLLKELREDYLYQSYSEYFYRGSFHIIIRYISFVFLGTLLISCYKYVRQKFLNINLKAASDLFIHFTLLWIVSSELIQWMEIYNYQESYKLGLSILWGVYAFILTVLGIWKNKKHLRIAAIVLFSVTLIKLFYYDMAHLETIDKTIVFVSLGILLLVISFLYNKYKHLIFEEDKK
jgi:uncharacterized membrane protein